jgi:ATP-dependent DNA helicase RecQ
VLAYFGEAGPASCGNCDTCLDPPESWDGTIAAQKLLSTVLRLQREKGQKFGAGQSIDILLGRRTEKVAQFGHDEMTVFGIGADLREAEWRGVVRQLLAQGLLAVQGEYGTLVLTEQSGTVLRQERPVMMRREPERSRSTGRAPKPRTAAAAVELPVEAAPVFERLRAWRASVAKEQGVPAYVVFHDATLRQIATLLPTTLAELATVNGVGESKLAKFGQQVIDTLAVGSVGTPSARSSATPGP